MTRHGERGALGCWVVDDPDGYFGEKVAAGYDDPADRMFQAAVIDPAISLDRRQRVKVLCVNAPTQEKG